MPTLTLKTPSRAGKRRQMRFVFTFSTSKDDKETQLSFLEDTLLAFQYAYYVKGRPLVTDACYDTLEREFKESCAAPEKTLLLSRPGSDQERDYPPSVRALSIYYGLAFHERRLEKQGSRPNPKDLHAKLERKT